MKVQKPPLPIGGLLIDGTLTFFAAIGIVSWMTNTDDPYVIVMSIILLIAIAAAWYYVLTRRLRRDK
jgi:sterol desaturase/sphingolipid hydroxylase (fatty acid hydroxylase superfamily)